MVRGRWAPLPMEAKGRAVVSGERPVGAASCKQQHNKMSYQPPTPPGRPSTRCFTVRVPSLNTPKGMGGELASVLKSDLRCHSRVGPAKGQFETMSGFHHGLTQTFITTFSHVFSGANCTQIHSRWKQNIFLCDAMHARGAEIRSSRPCCGKFANLAARL